MLGVHIYRQGRASIVKENLDKFMEKVSLMKMGSQSTRFLFYQGLEGQWSPMEKFLGKSL
jgi:hypothetical protein